MVKIFFNSKEVNLFFNINGILAINKPRNITSYDVIYKIRKKFIDIIKYEINNKNIEKYDSFSCKDLKKICPKIGHTGTLDPFAEGILVLCFGEATKLTNSLQSCTKEYIAEIKFGIKTITDDITGEVIAENKNLDFDIKGIQRIVSEKYHGEIIQEPPIYSAINVSGKRLYEYARKNIEVTIPKRKVFIYNFEILDFDKNENVLKVKINCSSGTYIRALARDIGNDLGTFGTLLSLKRIKIGNICEKDALNWAEIFFENENFTKNKKDKKKFEKFSKNFIEKIESNIISLEKIFEIHANKFYSFSSKDAAEINLSKKNLKKILVGNLDFLNKKIQNFSEIEILKLFFKKKLIAILNNNKEKNAFVFKYLFGKNI
ncbi:MAG: tRNA pseudouridine(55) synthase TruB [Elusimicrobiota bacterium]|jgi:tRNA pseudouridine55 synthase|nr:tRNA pseudouridine(55) synthase TruB [Elusimicrobiota bacterium]